jgi:hypothetical protein
MATHPEHRLRRISTRGLAERAKSRRIWLREETCGRLVACGAKAVDDFGGDPPGTRTGDHWRSPEPYGSWGQPRAGECRERRSQDVEEKGELKGDVRGAR